MTLLRFAAAALATSALAIASGAGAADAPPAMKKLPPLISVPDQVVEDAPTALDRSIVWDAAGRSEHRVTLPPGKVAEVCGKLAKGQAVAWSFKADRALDFNIHYHVGKDVVFPAKRDSSAGASGKLEVALDQDYCWMWTNKAGAAARFDLVLTR